MLYPVLIVEDDNNLREIISDYLQKKGLYVIAVGSGEEGLKLMKKDYIPVVILDLMLPGMSGFELIRKWKKRDDYDANFIVITAQAMTRNAIEAMKEGAFEYLVKPFDLEELEVVVKRALKAVEERETLDNLAREVTTAYAPEELLVGRTPEMQEVYKLIGRVANTDVTVLIEGESGTGKELVAKTIHYNSSRLGKPFIAINMAAIPGELLESELFGYEEGAFTGAVKKNPGKFALANGGTIFLDEIGEAPLHFQAKLLRVIEEKSVTPLGGKTPVKLDVRIIAATNRNLEEMVKRGEFREDLYYRLKVFSIKLPPLRERRDDIPILVDHFMKKFRKLHGVPEKEFTREAIEYLQQLEWPGNVRELENALLRVILTVPGRVVNREDLEEILAGKKAGKNRSFSEIVYDYLKDIIREFDDNVEGSTLYHDVLKKVEEPLIRLVLEKTGWNQVKASRLLGINRNTLRKKIKELDIKRE